MEANGRLLTWFMNPDASRKSYKVGRLVPNSYTVENTLDFNADGIADILWRHTSGRTLIWFMNANGTRRGFKV